jgi:8-oxo-dGTP diphosphatase
MSKKGKDTNRVVAILIENENNDILMGLRNDNNKYANPGGHLKEKENFFDGAQRELKEETGLDAQEIELIKMCKVGKNFPLSNKHLFNSYFKCLL